jgi:transposase, IS5 family
MLRDRYDPQDLFTQIPNLCLQFEPVLAHLDRLLGDDDLFTRVKADLARRRPKTLTRGRPSTPVEVILRMLVVKRLYGWSYEETERFVADSLILRQFCRLYWEAAPDDTTLIRWAHVIGNTTLEALNARVVALARQLQVTRGRKLRVDSTVVETTIHHPTDGSLLADGVRVLSRLLRRAQAIVGTSAALGREAFRNRTRSARRAVREMHRFARRQRESARPNAGKNAAKRAATAQEALKAAYERLLGVVEKSHRQAQRVSAVLRGAGREAAARLVEQFEGVLPQVERVMSQARRRVIEGVAVPAKEKLVSLFEPHTQIIKRGKAGRDVEFGRKVWLDEVDGGIISRYKVLEEPGQDYAYLEGSLAGHQEQFGRAPDVLAGDRGVSSPANEQLAKAAGVKRVVIPYAGKAPPERVQQERERWFRRGYRFRAGIEGRISVLKRRYGLGRCPDHGEDGLGRWVGWGIVTANLVQIARVQVARQTN